MTATARTRADRLRLVAEIETATHAAELLRSKEDALTRERDRLEGYARRADEEWHRTGTAATAAVLRARLLGASADLRSPSGTPADVRPEWRVSMGITYPGRVEVTPGTPPTVVSTAALRPAIECSRDALASAARAAAAAMAVRRLDTELIATRRRRHALEDRLVPSLDEARRTLDQQLEELDRDEATRIRMAVGREEAS